MPFAVTIAYVMLIFLRPQDWVPLLKAARPVDLVAIAGLAVVAHTLFGKGDNRNRQEFWRSPQVLIAMGIWAWMVMVYVSQTFFAEIIETWEFAGKKVLLFALIVITVNTRKRLDMLLLVIAGCWALLGFHGFLQYTTGSGFGGLEPAIRQSGPRIRAFGTFGGSNEFGGLAAFAVVLGVGYARRYVNNMPALLMSIAFTAWMSLTMIWSQSRQSMLILALGLTGLFVPKRLQLLVPVVALMGLLFMVAISFHSRWQGSLAADDSVIDRVTALTEGLRTFKKNPVFGVGTGRSYDAVGVGIQLHNSYLIVLVENGFVGICLFGGMFACSALQLRKVQLAHPDNPDDQQLQDIVPILMGLMLALMTSLFFTNRAYHTDNYIYWGLFTAAGRIAIGELAPAARPLPYRGAALAGQLGMLLIAAGAVFVILIHLTSRVFNTVMR